MEHIFGDLDYRFLEMEHIFIKMEQHNPLIYMEIMQK